MSTQNDQDNHKVNQLLVRKTLTFFKKKTTTKKMQHSNYFASNQIFLNLKRRSKTQPIIRRKISSSRFKNEKYETRIKKNTINRDQNL